MKETPAIRLHHAFKHLITPRALIIRPHLGNESVIKPQERSRTRVLSNTSRQKHFLFQCSPRKFLHFFSHIFLLDDYGKRKLTRIFLGEARISTYNIISTCRLSSKISFIVIRLPTTIRNIVGRKKRMSFHSHVPDRLILQSLEFYFTLLVETARVHFMLRRYGSSGIITVRL